MTTITSSGITTWDFSAKLHPNLPDGITHQLVYQPFSLVISLCMLALGASKRTFSQIEALAQCSAETPPSFLLDTIMSSNYSQIFDWTQTFHYLQDLSLDPQVNSQMQSIYGTHITHEDFYNNPPQKTANRINRLFYSLSHNIVSNAVSFRDLPYYSNMLVLNSLRISNRWLEPFWMIPSSAEFDLLPGVDPAGATVVEHPSENNRRTIDVLLMEQGYERTLLHTDYGKNVTGITLPFATQGLEMTIVLPSEASWEALREAEQQMWNETAFSEMKVYSNIHIPSFSVHSTMKMKVPLRKTGVTDAFNVNFADFSKAFRQWGSHAFVSEIVGISNVTITHKGIGEAYEPKEVQYQFFLLPDDVEKEEFVLNRPFLYVIKLWGEVLAVGRILNPKAK